MSYNPYNPYRRQEDEEHEEHEEQIYDAYTEPRSEPRSEPYTHEDLSYSRPYTSNSMSMPEPDHDSSAYDTSAHYLDPQAHAYTPYTAHSGPSSPYAAPASAPHSALNSAPAYASQGAGNPYNTTASSLAPPPHNSAYYNSSYLSSHSPAYGGSSTSLHEDLSAAPSQPPAFSDNAALLAARPYQGAQHSTGHSAAPQQFQGGRMTSFLSQGQSMLSSQFTGGHEYAEDPFDYVQVPIQGDSYVLNGVEELEEGQDEEKAAAPRVVNLFRGNLVLDCPVSQRLISQFPDHQAAREFTHMRYSAATCDPADFGFDKFTLRQMCYSQPRRTELVIAITIYNEDDILLARTLQGVFNNIRHLCSRSRSGVWGAEAWKKVVVCVIADGRSKINPRARALLAALGCYQDGLAKNVVNDKPVAAHIYEYTTMLRIKKVTDTVEFTSENATPVQMMFCLKEKNQKKINSHRWLFQALCPILDPNVVVLLDAGTRPGNKAIYHLWKRFDRNPRVAGACGEIAAMLGTGGNKLLNPLVAAQNFEYKMSNILDKPTESVFGFITVLPGAFSAYRYQALQNDEAGHGPLEKYFKGEKLEATGGIFSANMYLAEDRILCWALVAKPHCNWTLTFVKSAVAHTDVPESLAELVLQRRRWLNGSFFAAIYAQAHMFEIWRTSHSLWRKLFFHIEFLYQFIQLVFSWFSLANFFLVFKILASSLGNSSMGFAPGAVLGTVFTYLYGACVIATFVLSFGNRPQGTRIFYTVLVVFFAVMMAYVIFAAIFVAVKSITYEVCVNDGFHFTMFFSNKTFRDLIISLFATYLLYIVGSLMMLDPWHVVTSMVQYVLLSPTYINIFNVYAFCNTHDISWGTKGDTAVKHDLGVVQADSDGKVEVELPTSAELVDSAYTEEAQLLATAHVEEKKEPNEADLRTDYYAAFRSTVVLAWGLMNIGLIAVVLNIGVTKEDTTTGETLKRAVELGDALGALSKRAVCTEPITSSSNTVTIYLAVIMWSVAITAAFKFLVCLVFMFQRIGFHCCGKREHKSMA